MVDLNVGNTPNMTFGVDKADGGTVTVTVSGELDITKVDALAAAVAPALERGPERLIVLLCELSFADSSAIALWVHWASCPPSRCAASLRSCAGWVIESMGLTETLNLTP